MSSAQPENIILRAADKWQDSEGLPQMNLIRLGLLRETLQNLHSEKSRCLAEGRKQAAQAIRSWEQKIEELKDLPLLGNLMELVQSSPLPSTTQLKRKRLLPEALYNRMDREKLERYDRKWESAIAAEAISLNWHFWVLDSWVHIPFLEEWNKTLTEKLWPHGLILFTETSVADHAEIVQEDEDSAFWRGSWMTVLAPNFRDPKELSLNSNYWPGAVLKAPTPPQWKPIYP